MAYIDEEDKLRFIFLEKHNKLDWFFFYKIKYTYIQDYFAISCLVLCSNLFLEKTKPFPIRTNCCPSKLFVASLQE